MVEYADIQEAHERIKNYINLTPVLHSSSVDGILGAQIFFKCENFQKVGAFKFRGAYNTLSQLSPTEKEKGVITHSSGNHAQAVAKASLMMNIPATIIMPSNSPKVKVNATRDTYQARVVMCGNTIESRQDTCEQIRIKENQKLIHPYDNDHIIAGAGTAAYELLQEIPDLEIVIAPVGGGGLISGTSIACRGFDPNIQVIAGEPCRADDAYRSLQSGKIEKNENPDTIADGLRTMLTERTFKIIKANVNQIIRVTEDQIVEAMQLIWERMKIIVEPSSAVPLAVVMSNPSQFAGKKIGIIISGGNVDLSEFFNSIRNKIRS
jgi:threonine dehydratase